MVIHSTEILTIAIDGSYPSLEDWIAQMAKIYGPIGLFWASLQNHPHVRVEVRKEQRWKW